MKKSRGILRCLVLLVFIGSLTGCLYWVRAFQTYLQLKEFDQHFVVDDYKKFVVHFNQPILYSDDLVSLAKLQPSSKKVTVNGSRWRYTFRKVDEDEKLFEPELNFFFDLDFNHQDQVAAWHFSSLFLEIAPPKFLEASLRSLAGGELDKDKRQLRASSFVKIDAELPQKSAVIARLGKPIEIKQEAKQEVYYYHFLLESPEIEAGYEDRALSVVKLTFDKKTSELTRMSGRFAGLKISIRYRKFLTNSTN